MTYRRHLQAGLLATAAVLMAAPAAMSADLIVEPPIVDEVLPFKGWYIRGDFGYNINRQADDIELSPIEVCDPIGGCVLLGEPGFDSYDLDDGFSVGLGVGAHLNQFVRWDITADAIFGGSVHAELDNLGDPAGDPTQFSTFEGDMTVVTVLTSLYADVGTYAGITPYVGAGIGFAHVDYSDATKTECLSPPVPSGSTTTCGSAVDPGAVIEETSLHGDSSLRLAWALSAGAAYNFNENVAIDGGYRFVRIDEGPFTTDSGSKDGGIDMHQIRIGARYKFH